MLFLPIVSADVYLNPTLFGSLLFLLLFPIIVFIEALIFFVLINKLFKIKSGFWKILLVVLAANAVTSLYGLFVPLYTINTKYIHESFNFLGIGIAFVLSILIEWLIYSFL